jgi:hypothetical protein
MKRCKSEGEHDVPEGKNNFCGSCVSENVSEAANESTSENVHDAAHVSTSENVRDAANVSTSENVHEAANPSCSDINHKKLSFQHKWLKQYKWLCSEEEFAFCTIYRKYPEATNSKSKLLIGFKDLLKWRHVGSIRHQILTKNVVT